MAQMMMRRHVGDLLVLLLPALLSLLGLWGCGGGGDTPQPLPFTPVSRELFVARFDTVSVLDSAAGGSEKTLRSFGNVTGLQAPVAIAVDTAHGELVVANADSVTIYPVPASGNSRPLRTIAGTVTGIKAPRDIAVDAARDRIYLLDSSGAILVFSRTAEGNAAPVRTISGDSTGLSNPGGIAIDAAHGEIFVTNTRGIGGPYEDSVTVYDLNADGNSAPLRTLAGTATGFNGARGIAVDTVSDEILVSNRYSGLSPSFITAYPRTANGNTAPARRITYTPQGSSISLITEGRVVVDTEHDELIMLSSGQVMVYPRGATNETPPLRTIRTEGQGGGIAAGGDEIFVTGSTGNSISVYRRLSEGAASPVRAISAEATQLTSAVAMAVDSRSDEYVTVTRCGSGWCISSYSGTASGDARPLRTISLTSAPTIRPVAIALNPARDELLLLNGSDYHTETSVLVYERKATGSAPPRRTISGITMDKGNGDPAAVTSIEFSAIGVDPVHDELFITAYHYRTAGTLREVRSAVLVYPAGAEGDTTPRRVVMGPATGLDESAALAVDTMNDEIVVASRGDGGAITAYPRTAAGDVAPLRRIAGDATDLRAPHSLAVDTVNNEILAANQYSITVYPRTANGNVPPLRVFPGDREQLLAIGLGKPLIP